MINSKVKLIICLFITCMLYGCAADNVDQQNDQDYELVSIELKETLTENEIEDGKRIFTLDKLKDGIEALDEIEQADISQSDNEDISLVEIQITFVSDIKQEMKNDIKLQVEEYAKSFLNDDTIITITLK